MTGLLIQVGKVSAMQAPPHLALSLSVVVAGLSVPVPSSPAGCYAATNSSQNKGKLVPAGAEFERPRVLSSQQEIISK